MSSSQAPGVQVPAGAHVDEVREAATRAAGAARVLRFLPAAQLDDALRTAASLLRARRDPVLAANALDVEAALAAGSSAGVLDRLRLDEQRLEAMAMQLEVLAEVPEPEQERALRSLDGGEQVLERRIPVGVVGAIFEARPNVTVDIASQLLKARSAGVLRTGVAALRSAAALVEQVLAPALSASSVPAQALQLLRNPGHEAAEALLSQPKLIPLVVVRGSGAATRHLAAVGAAQGVRVLAHADGGGVLYLHAACELAMATDLIRAGLDRLGVCNRVNLILVDRDFWPVAQEAVLATLGDLGIRASLPPHPHALGHEWALDAGAQASVTIALVDGPRDGAETASTQTSALAATVCTADPAAAREFIDCYEGTGVFWNLSTRLLDGFKLLGLPETGISVDRVPGPRGPVTYRDLVLRQFVVRPAPA